MQVSKVEHRPVNILFDYFERAVEELGLRAWTGLLRPGNEQYFQNKISPAVYRILEAPTWEQEREEILSNPDGHLRWESRDNPEEEILAHYRLQAAIVATLMGDGWGKRHSKRKYERAGKGLRTLAAQLIVEHMNRKLVITYFLGNLTDGRVGLTYKELPTKSQVLQWVSEIEQVQLTNRLGEITRFKYQ